MFSEKIRSENINKKIYLIINTDRLYIVVVTLGTSAMLDARDMNFVCFPTNFQEITGAFLLRILLHRESEMIKKNWFHLKLKELTGIIVVTLVSAEFPRNVNLPDDLDVLQERDLISGTFLMARSYLTGNW